MQNCVFPNCPNKRCLIEGIKLIFCESCLTKTPQEKSIAKQNAVIIGHHNENMLCLSKGCIRSLDVFDAFDCNYHLQKKREDDN